LSRAQLINRGLESQRREVLIQKNQKWDINRKRAEKVALCARIREIERQRNRDEQIRSRGERKRFIIPTWSDHGDNLKPRLYAKREIEVVPS
jgi:hypothetical protein